MMMLCTAVGCDRLAFPSRVVAHSERWAVLCLLFKQIVQTLIHNPKWEYLPLRHPISKQQPYGFNAKDQIVDLLDLEN